MSLRQRLSYIGVTGVTRRSETEALLKSAEKAFPSGFNRQIMIGVLASLKTLHGKSHGKPQHYPPLQNIKDIFVKHDLALNLIHYATKEPETLCDQLLKLSDATPGVLNGFQLNIAWPNREQIDKFLTVAVLSGESWSPTLVLQVGRRAMEMTENSPEKVATKVSEYVGLVDYVLLDPSGGRGEFMNPQETETYLQAIQARNLEMGLVVAGGLSELSVKSLVGPLALKYPDLSTDAEERLRDALDTLDVVASEFYLQKTVELFSPKPTSTEPAAL